MLRYVLYGWPTATFQKSFFLFITEFLLVVIEGILASNTFLYSKGSRFESRWELGKFSDRFPLILHVSSATPDAV